MIRTMVAGIDEAGRGALAGPVVACACIVRPEVHKRRGFWSPHTRGTEVMICDSKQLTPAERERSLLWLLDNASFGIGIVSQASVDQVGILKANHMAMCHALSLLRRKTPVEHVFVDGKDAYTFDVPHTSIIRGDQSEPCIAAASIIAKVTRDHLMCRACSIFPGYGFSEHKGYGTQSHYESLTKLGVSILHRKTFTKTFLSEQLELL